MKQYRGTDEPRRGYHVVEAQGTTVIDRPVEEDEVIDGVTYPLKYRIAELGALLAQFVGHDPAPEGICFYCGSDRSHDAGCLWVRAQNALREEFLSR